MNYLDDTIAGIATPLGNGGISIIRISGDNALKAIKNIFKGNIDNVPETHKVYFGNIHDVNKNILDEVLVTIMLAPKTYTREDVVEVNCHGGIKIVNRVLEEILKQDVRLAEPGEFTKRAFLNGRIDLSSAEAVIDVINAKTEISREASIKQLTGELCDIIKNYRKSILSLIASIEASIDYPEHEESQTNLQNIQILCKELLLELKKLSNTFDKGKVIKNGIETVIVGIPNSGKSSLLNELLQEDRAIVTDVAGTTRDTLTEYITLNNILLKITDTAGIRDTEDIVEKIGVEKSKKLLDTADLILMIIDSSKELSVDDIDVLKNIKDKKKIILINKIDLEQNLNYEVLNEYVDKKYVIKVSIKYKKGLDRLEKSIEDLFYSGELDNKDETIITSFRHKNLIEESIKSLENAVNSLKAGYTEDIISIDLQNAYSALGEILGESINEDLLDEIFSQFCLGK